MTQREPVGMVTDTPVATVIGPTLEALLPVAKV